MCKLATDPAGSLPTMRNLSPVAAKGSERQEAAMSQIGQNTMQAVAIDRFGGIETLTPRTLPVPEVGPDEVLIRVEAAGVGVWDPFERKGGFAKAYQTHATCPYVLGTDGAGTVAAVGERGGQFREGDRVYGMSLANPKGGVYAHYAAL